MRKANLIAFGTRKSWLAQESSGQAPSSEYMTSARLAPVMRTSDCTRTCHKNTRLKIELNCCSNNCQQNYSTDMLKKLLHSLQQDNRAGSVEGATATRSEICSIRGEAWEPKFTKALHILQHTISGGTQTYTKCSNCKVQVRSGILKNARENAGVNRRTSTKMQPTSSETHKKSNKITQRPPKISGFTMMMACEAAQRTQKQNREQTVTYNEPDVDT